VAAAAELPSPLRLAPGTGKGTGKALQAASGLPAVGYHRPNPELSDWNPTAIAEGGDGASERTEAEYEEHVFQGRRLFRLTHSTRVTRSVGLSLKHSSQT